MLPKTFGGSEKTYVLNELSHRVKFLRMVMLLDSKFIGKCIALKAMFYLPDVELLSSRGLRDDLIF